MTNVTCPAGTVSGLASHPLASVTVIVTCPGSPVAAEPGAAAPEAADPDVVALVEDVDDDAWSLEPHPARARAPVVSRTAGHSLAGRKIMGSPRGVVRRWVMGERVIRGRWR
jgi:hypothetical protein